MQQIALPSIYDAPRRKVLTQPFPLVRRRHENPSAPPSTRRFLAGLLFGVLMSMVLALLGYEARLYSDTHPNLLGPALTALEAAGR